MQYTRTFKKHSITVQRESRKDNWYIRVTAPCGSYAYDGWWTDSASKTAKEAFEEAKRGAQLDPDKEARRVAHAAAKERTQKEQSK
ncbi:hypothetical protein [Comamonas thiooxydans]|uniref:hypothetical protein n=1 Tax=Comamonas thiooxydans TaxID=363952 RepID=UPI0005F7AF26|nr:hypothetical protein [Comamonas thiooxydans]CUA99386.1 hypothetical protein Ga0061062_108117 [Comamonas thiooxydans]